MSNSVAFTLPLLLRIPLLAPLARITDDTLERRLLFKRDSRALEESVLDRDRQSAGLEEGGEEVHDSSASKTSGSRHRQVNGRLWMDSILAFAS